jgi:aspartate 1-decarboxylase
MPIQYDTDEERKLHLNVIHSLADQYHLDEAMIREIYESKLEGLMNGARVKTYLSVLAARYVKSMLLESRSISGGPVQVERAH